MDSRDRGLGQATFRDFVEFMGGESRSAAYLRPSGERGVSPRRAGSVEQVGHRYIVHGNDPGSCRTRRDETCKNRSCPGVGLQECSSPKNSGQLWLDFTAKLSSRAASLQ